MNPDAAASPWRAVLSLVDSATDALVVMWLFEYRDAELLANGCSIAEVVDGFPSERAVADVLARRMLERHGGAFSYTDFYRPTRANVAPTREEVRAFVKRCSDVGVCLRYDDGTEVALPTPAGC